MIGIGTDLVDIDRFREVLTRTPGMRTRLFCEAELAYADQSGDPADQRIIEDGADVVVVAAAAATAGGSGGPETRAARRQKEQGGDYDTVLADVRARDARDSERATAPLVAAEDAHVIDTSDMSIDEAVAAAIAIITSRKGG